MLGLVDAKRLGVAGHERLAVVDRNWLEVAGHDRPEMAD